MKAMTKELERELNRQIDETLKRWQDGTDKPSDGFDILRWARKGWLKRND